jgi:putative peptidoglycan lipid II flippase
MSLARSSLVVGLAAVASRLLGFARDVMIARVLGAGVAADAFLIAFRLPNTARRILNEGGLNAGVVPLYSRIRAEAGPDAAADFAGLALGAGTLVLLALTGLVEVAAPLVVLLLAGGYADEAEKFALAVFYTRLAFPFVALAGLASLIGALLNAERHFAAAAVAPVLVNALLIAVLLALGAPDEATAARQGLWLALAVSASGALHLAILAAALYRLPGGFRLARPRLTPDIRRLGRLVLPAAAASGATQLAVLVATAVASQEASAVSWLYYADRVAQLPLSLIGVAIGTVFLSEVSTRLAAGDTAGAARAQSRALEGALALALPAAVALVVLGGPISSILFERGAFGAGDAAGTAALLAMLALGLPAAAAAKVLAQPFFAREALAVPLGAGVVALVVTGLAAMTLQRLIGVAGIGLGLTLGLVVHAGVLQVASRRSFGFRHSAGTRRRILLLLLSALIMGLAVGLAEHLFQSWLAAETFLARAGTLALICAGGVLVFGSSAFLLGAVDPRLWRTPA